MRHRPSVMKLVLLAALLGVTTAHAHQPQAGDGETWVIDKPKISWALYGGFETGDEVFTVELTYDEPFALPFELMTEHRAKYENFRPAYAIVGPGFPEPSDADRDFLPRDVPDGAGVFIERNDDEDRRVYFESILRRSFWTSGTIALPLVVGDYEIWIWSPDGDTGDFVFGFGVEEDFSDGGFEKIPQNWSDYAY